MNRLFRGLFIVLFAAMSAHADEPLRVGVFEIDASPPVGSPLGFYGRVKEVKDPLTCRGVVLLGSGQPIVLCALDWIGTANDGTKVFRQQLAEGAGTSPDRVAVHCLHSHDAPWCDLSAEALTAKSKAYTQIMDVDYFRDVMRRAQQAVAAAVKAAQPVTDIGLGTGTVEQVASNRRVLGPDGKVLHIRWSATTDAAARDFPEGVIDPQLKAISFWNKDQPIAVLTYYATHPQSYYRVEQATPDFPGLARNQRQAETGVPHIHFNGAAGNITAGKYNDGAHENRPVLTARVAKGMKAAWEQTKKSPVKATDVEWSVAPALMPANAALKEDDLQKVLANDKASAEQQVMSAWKLTWLNRCQSGDAIPIGGLKLGKAYVTHLPGELFIEYQLAAQAMRPDDFVCMAAYGDGSPGYIGTEISYSQGGYEPTASNVGPGAEQVLIDALRKLLGSKETGPARLGVEAAALETEFARNKVSTK